MAALREAIRCAAWQDESGKSGISAYNTQGGGAEMQKPTLDKRRVNDRSAAEEMVAGEGSTNVPEICHGKDRDDIAQVQGVQKRVDALEGGWQQRAVTLAALHRLAQHMEARPAHLHVFGMGR